MNKDLIETMAMATSQTTLAVRNLRTALVAFRTKRSTFDLPPKQWFRRLVVDLYELNPRDPKQLSRVRKAYVADGISDEHLALVHELLVGTIEAFIEDRPAQWERLKQAGVALRAEQFRKYMTFRIVVLYHAAFACKKDINWPVALISKLATFDERFSRLKVEDVREQFAAVKIGSRGRTSHGLGSLAASLSASCGAFSKDAAQTPEVAASHLSRSVTALTKQFNKAWSVCGEGSAEKLSQSFRSPPRTVKSPKKHPV